MKKSQGRAGSRQPTVLAVEAGTSAHVLGTGRSIGEALSKAKSKGAADRPPAIMFVPRKDAIHIF
ncbi:hypothetical protein ACFLSJ_01070 [Verrucomicrobiota bacterium]